MPNATSAGYRVGYLAEVTPGTTPSAALTLIRTIGGGGKLSSQYVESDELHLGEVPDVVRVGVDGRGVINGELSYAALDDFLQAIMGGTWTTNVLKYGSTKRTFTIEDQYTDAGIYIPWRYCLIEGISITFATGAKPTFKVTYVVGKPPTSAGTATVGSTGATAAPTNNIMSPISSIQVFQEGGSGSLLAGAPGVTTFTIDITRPVITQPQLGSLDYASADPSGLVVKGSFTCYMATKALLDKYLADTQSSLGVTVGGAAALSYAFLMAKLRFTDGGPQETSKNQPVLQTYPFQATYDATTSTLQVTRDPS